ncbi:hypothetical protein CC86DRAFT_405543 [Ophiobolus disseminans]|uniref:Uncharacterized protein n=1 Tax=Ophiobolus disseminans TaxID=1469910 RepID=A0A6A7A4B5_9PLEO|nr:hypothetical protein CC86DRAFT_405543 [Ophiobolus disseminans]
MCDAPVFAAYDVTPEQWSDFSNTANITEEHVGWLDPATDPTPPYVLIYSRSQENLHRTGALAAKVTTDFKGASYADMYTFPELTCKDEEISNRLISAYFLVLDAQSSKDRQVVLINKTLGSLYIDEADDVQITNDGKDDTVWMKHRIPYEKVAFFCLVRESHPGDEGDEFLQNMTKETIEGL